MTDKTKEQWYDECIALRDEGKMEEALANLLKLADAWPDFALAHLALGLFYYRLGNVSDSMNQLKIACELEQNDPFYFTALSVIAIKGGMHQEAEEALMKAQEYQFRDYMKKAAEEENNQ